VKRDRRTLDHATLATIRLMAVERVLEGRGERRLAEKRDRYARTAETPNRDGLEARSGIKNN
jgi:hypothetical protein